MAGIYIHIPFCAQKCAYCNFYSMPMAGNESMPTKYADAIISEITLRRKEDTETIETIYFGGGTPSLLNAKDLERIFETLKRTFEWANNMEITLEGNPESLTKTYLDDLWKYTPINRISIGVQSFFEDDLKYLNRKHTHQQAIEAIQNAQNRGFERLSVDLIYGIPTLTGKKWKENLTQFFAMDVTHLSAYALTVEPDTLLDKQIHAGKTRPPNEEQTEQHHKTLHQQLRKHHFEAYETSNFCKNKHYAKHNANYWNCTPYLGFGAAAHSYSGATRSWNIADVNAYIAAINSRTLPNETEHLSKETQYNEYVMTAIRTQWGIDLNIIKNRFGSVIANYFQQQVRQITTDWITRKDNHYIATPKGASFADAIAGRLFCLKS